MPAPSPDPATDPTAGAAGTPPHPTERLEVELDVLMRRARAYQGRLARQVHPDLEAGAYSILVRLAETGGERLTDMAEAFGVGKPTVSRQVTVLDGLGLVRRTPDPQDARSQVLHLTADGSARLEAARSARRARFQDLMGTWPEEDVATLADLLHRFNEPALPDDRPG